MSTRRDIRLSPQQLAFKLACAEAVRAAGGQDFVAGECGRTQSRIADYCSGNTGDFMPLDVAAKIEALSSGAPGHPHITRALARAAGKLLLDEVGEAAPRSLPAWLGEIAGESADVIRLLASGTVMPGDALPSVRAMAPAARRRLAGELDQLIDLLAGFNAVLSEADTS